MQSMIPKREIGALQFLQKNSEFDGRGVVIAVWDTGVDPTARGLQVTSQGKPKIIDLIDASGSGDVNIITDSSRTITTLTGRIVSVSVFLQIPLHWKPVDGLIRVGVKSAAEIFPAALLDQLRAEAMDRYWRPTIQRLCDYLKEAAAFSIGPLHSDIISSLCLADGTASEVVTDVREMEILGSVLNRSSYYIVVALLYFTVKILNAGDLLQIVTNCGSHGTHVAAIAANCKDDKGLKIVSIKIADTHLLGMETNTSLLCALNWTTKLKCDIVNYSFGEKAFLPNFGRIYTHLTQFVLHTNVAFVTSGGNGGPALGTVGSPGGAVDGVIGNCQSKGRFVINTQTSLEACIPDALSEG
ncbi:unnamed protein product [Hydatigera taeniaeformis]|uniref:Peptidase_S8 domain-containing protein n=1 Tax=Hydatigena taeniaeformis TaxID=6205 RepID=A0A0R3WKB5_HYDTA|nr:unnamed protein product [Hydatigera taeniaeformis]